MYDLLGEREALIEESNKYAQGLLEEKKKLLEKLEAKEKEAEHLGKELYAKEKEKENALKDLQK